MQGTRATSRRQRQQAGSDGAVRIQRDASGPGAIRTLPPSVDAVLRSPGQALGATQQRALHTRMGFDFSGIRIHHDAQAAASARELSAHAYTMGEHVVFGAGRYAPGSASGERLLRHELTHVVQQRQGRVPGSGVVTDAGLEGEADRVADGARLLAGTAPAGGPARVQALQRFVYEDTSAQAEPAPAGTAPEQAVEVDVVMIGDVSKSAIDNDFAVANEIYNPYGFAIEKGTTYTDEHPKDSAGRRLPVRIKESLEADATLRQLVHSRSGGAKPTGIWVQAVPASTRGRTFNDSNEAVCMINAASEIRDTFAHELGHVLIGEGHIKASPELVSLFKQKKKRLVSMDPRRPTDPQSQLNLMAPGASRISHGQDVDRITEEQLQTMRENARKRFVKTRTKT